MNRRPVPTDDQEPSREVQDINMDMDSVNVTSHTENVINAINNSDTANQGHFSVEKIVNEKIISHESKDIPKNQLINNLLVMAIKWRRGTTYTVAQDILKLVNISSQTNNFKSSKYYWKTILNRYSQSISTHYICDNCDNYLGSDNDHPINCQNCQLEINYKSIKV
ncbi:uncharacterized protein LOC130670148 isoform X2 [Microplitis mediator]|uniref:uncharacterized protein LOC130670148 isoform X2 n=1 Tax=Microplitis mediator TaxID=375433 RepID=UPI002554900F|nr:uncharacterized protein LOC130670148 isoform X2 [Microplitis mediator]